MRWNPIRANALLPPNAALAVLAGWPRREAICFYPRSTPPVALAVELHGSGLDPLRQYQMSGLADLLVADGIAVLLPQGGKPFQLMPALASGFAWNLPGVPLPGETTPIDEDARDADYIYELVDNLQAAHHLPDAPLFLAGYSGGARLASNLLVSGRLQWAAAGLVAGLRSAEASQQRPPPTISFHGVADPINPFAGGLGARWDLGVAEAGHRYALAQGCAPVHQEFHIPGARLRVYISADGAPSLSLYAVADAGHAWPGTRDENHLKFFGPGSDSIDASALIANFFRSRLNNSRAMARQTGIQVTPQ